MSDSKEDFRKWFVETLAPLSKNGEAGFVFMLVTFPLLERYLRNKLQCEGKLTTDFYKAIGDLLQIQGMGEEFWDYYRNGLLHRVTFKSGAGISGYSERAVYFHSEEERFYVNPLAFFERVTALILNDFATYEGGNKSYQLAQPVLDSMNGQSTYVPTINVCLPFPSKKRPSAT